MNRRSILVATAALSCFWIVLAGVGTVAEQSSDVENVKAASSALYASLSTVDIGAVENAWAREPYIRYIGPTNKGNLEQYSLSAISALAERAVAALVPR